MKSTELLMQEHKLILRALDVLDGLTASMEAQEQFEEDDVDRVLDFLRWFADAHHQAKEETILFPAIKASTTAEERPVRHMMFEHDQERLAIQELEKDVRLGKLSEFADRAGRLSSTLRNHIYKEDKLLFPAADAVLDQQQDAAILEKLERFDTALDKEILGKKVCELHTLEWKYLRKK
jgi:hemerythrin-like domain-containing protein